MSGNHRRPDGSLIPGDALFVREVSGISQPLEEMCPYVYEAARPPPTLAARWKETPVELIRVVEGFRSLCQRYDFVTMEAPAVSSARSASRTPPSGCPMW